ncbi:MAG: hypothetical protein K0U74_09460 [Alphaproteobacteria bacterium]|nr:hypothetical protein [Alphaproteobacteria bacterium]
MSDTHFPLSADDDIDDLPRTLRREHAARAAREREASAPEMRATPAPELGDNIDQRYGQEAYAQEELTPTVVQQLDLSFFHMMAFFLKAVLAAIPALILLGAIIWGAGEILQHYFPWLVKMKIVILFPDGA